MSDWLRRLTAFSLAVSLVISQSLVPTMAAAQSDGSLQGEVQYLPLLEGTPTVGEVTRSDASLLGEYFDVLTFAGYANDEVTITIAPTRMTGILTVQDRSGKTLGELFFAPSARERSLRVVIPTDGRYTVYLGSERGGPYSVSLSSLGNSGDVDPSNGMGNFSVVTLRSGQWQEGELTEADGNLGGFEGRLIDFYGTSGTPGDEYRVIVESEDFLPALIMTNDPDEEATVEIGRDGRAVLVGRIKSNSVLTVAVVSADRQPGRYRIMVEPVEQR